MSWACSCKFTKRVVEKMGTKEVPRVIHGCGKPAVKKCQHGFRTCEKCKHGYKNEKEFALEKEGEQ